MLWKNAFEWAGSAEVEKNFVAEQRIEAAAEDCTALSTVAIGKPEEVEEPEEPEEAEEVSLVVGHQTGFHHHH